mgnify:CR=1 FL=1
MLIILLFLVLIIIPIWCIYEKADKPGWAAIIPIYNSLVWFEIINKPWYWLLLICIPYIGLIWSVWSINLLVKRFGYSEGFTVGVLFLPFIFLPIIAFGNSKYIPVD